MRGTVSSDDLNSSPDRHTSVVNEYRIEMRDFDTSAAEPSLN